MEKDSDLELLQFRRLITADQYRRLYDLTLRYVGNGGKVLDWGCGNGHVSYVLSRLGFNTSAFTLQGTPRLSAFTPDCEFVVGYPNDPERLPFDSQTFDAIFSVGVLEHVREVGGTEIASLREIRRILRPSGFFLCYHLPNRFSYIEGLAGLLPKAHHHEHRFTAEQIQRLCASAGFTLVEIGRYGALPRNFWARVPRQISDSRAMRTLWNSLDRVLEYALSPVVQNFYFVARPGR